MLYIFLIFEFIYSFYVKSVYRVRIQTILTLNILSLILLAYVFGLFDLLKYALPIFLVLQGISIIFFVIVKRDININFNQTDLIDVLVLFGSLIFLVRINSGRFFLRWDEFSYWGITAKRIFDYGSILLVETPAGAVYFPPGVGILQYLANFFSYEFNESFAYLSVSLMNVILIMSSLRRMKTTLFVLSFVLINIVMSILFSMYFSTVLVDAILAVSFMFSLSFVFNDGQSKLDVFIYVLSLFWLTSIKTVGYQFAFVSIVMMAIKPFLAAFFEKKSIRLKNLRDFLLLPYIYVVSKSFDLLTQTEISFIGSGSGVSVLNYNQFHISNLLSNNLQTNQLKTIENFVGYLESTPFQYIQFNYLTWPLILLLIIVLVKLFIKSMNLDIRKIVSYGIFVISYYFYLGYLLLYYLYNFVEFSNGEVGSIDRYVPTYLAVILLVFIMIFLNAFENIKLHKVISSLSLVFLLMMSYDFMTTIHRLSRDEAEYSIFVRNVYIPMIEFSRQVPEGSKVALVAQNTNGYEWFVARYHFSKFELEGGYSYGYPYYDEDHYTQVKSVEELTQHWLDVDYVFFYIVDERFMSYYHYLFSDPKDVKNNQAYEVIKYNDDQNIVLVKVFE